MFQEEIVQVLVMKNDYSNLHRILNYQFVINHALSDSIFLGAGYGSYGLLFLGEDIVAYPHNLFMEILFEMGLIGFILIVLMVIMAMNYRDDTGVFWGIFIFMLVNAMFSGDITGNSGLFFIIQLLRLLNSKALGYRKIKDGQNYL